MSLFSQSFYSLKSSFDFAVNDMIILSNFDLDFVGKEIFLVSGGRFLLPRQIPDDIGIKMTEIEFSNVKIKEPDGTYPDHWLKGVNGLNSNIYNVVTTMDSGQLTIRLINKGNVTILFNLLI